MKKLMFHPIAAVYLGFNALIKFASSFFMVTYVLFLSEKGMDLLQINLINTCYMIAVILAELPTGSFADSFGRHRSFSLSFFLMALSTFIYFVSGSFMLFVLAEVVAALGHTFFSGSIEAWLVDSLKARGEEYRQAEIFRHETAFHSFGIIAGVMFGAYLGKFNLAWPWLASTIAMFIVGCLSLFIKENYVTDRQSLKENGLGKQLSEAFQSGLKNRDLLFIMLFGACLTFAIQALNMQWTLLFQKEYNFSTPQLGLLFIGISFSIILGAQFSKVISQRLGQRLGEKTAIILPQIGTALAIVIAAQASLRFLVISFFLVHEFGRGIIKPLQQNFINKRLASKNRATLLSLDSMFTQSGALLGLVASGFIAKMLSIRSAWLYSGLFLLLVIFLFVISVRFKKHSS